MIRYWKYALVLLLVLVAGMQDASAQRRRGEVNRRFQQTLEKTAPKDTLTPAQLDSIRTRRDSLHRADSVFKADSMALLGKSSLERPAFTNAADSSLEVFSNGQRKIFYWGGVTVEYQDFKLTADYMEYDMNTATVYARGTLDTLTGDWKGMPEMTQGGKTYRMEELRYNFNSGKALIHNMVTQEDEGLLQGKNIKMLPDKSINITEGMYTVCDLEEPHYFLKLKLAKVVTQPSQKTVFGPAIPYVEGVPLPIMLPFGFVPEKPTRATGMLMPTFGEEKARGFFAKDMGMYFVIGDYFDLSVTGDVYTLGSWALNVNSRYMVRYKFTGNFGFNYSHDQTGEKGAADFFETSNFGVRWSHQQDSKAVPGTSFSASVNFSSPSNNRYNSHSINETLQNQISSSISFSRNWNGKFNLSVNALHSQNSRDSSYTFTLPNITFSVTRFYPFKQKNRVGKEKFYEKFSLGYNTTLQNKINFKASEFNKPGFYDKFQNGMSHNFQIGLPNFTLANYINIAPSVSYGMNWFFRKTEKSYDPDTGQVVDHDSGMFRAFGITQTYSFSAAASTRLYGLFQFGAHRKVQAIRHVITPSISVNFQPELGTRANGWRSLDYTDTLGVAHHLDYNIYQGQVNSYPSKGRNGGLSFSFGNNLEAKVSDFRDTTGTGYKKVKLLDQLNINGSYNFLADSLRLSNIGVSMSTNVFGKVGISANANFDPYLTVLANGQAVRINKLRALDNWRRPLHLTNASASLSYTFSGEGRMTGNDGRGSASSSPADYYQRFYYHPVTGEYIPGGYLYYMNPNSPWSVNFNYNFNYTSYYGVLNGELVLRKNFTQTVGLNGNFKITPRLSIQAQTGFDLMAMKLTTTQVSFSYDLHCFNISVSWIPIGTYRSYSFRIAANASALADLLQLRKNESWWDRR